MSFAQHADELVRLVRAVGKVDAHGNLHAPKGLGELSGRFVGDELPRAPRHVAGAWVEAEPGAAIAERIRRGARAWKEVLDNRGLKGYFASYAEFVKATLANKRVYHNGPHTITVDRDIGSNAAASIARILQPQLDRLVEMYPPSGPLNVHIVSAKRMRRLHSKVHGKEPLGFADLGGHSMTLTANTVWVDTFGGRNAPTSTLAHEYGHLMDTHGDDHRDLWERFRDEMDEYAATDHVEAFASMFALWDANRGQPWAGRAARAYGERYGWKRG